MRKASHGLGKRIAVLEIVGDAGENDREAEILCLLTQRLKRGEKWGPRFLKE